MLKLQGLQTGLPTPTRRKYVPVGSFSPIQGFNGWLRVNRFSLGVGSTLIISQQL